MWRFIMDMKICLWIWKYVYGFKNSNPFVKYVYDNYSNLEKIYNEKLDKINKEYPYPFHSLQHCNPQQCSHGYTKPLLDKEKSIIKRELNIYPNIIQNIKNKTREYYYVNYDEFLDLFEKKINMVQEISFREVNKEVVI